LVGRLKSAAERAFSIATFALPICVLSIFRSRRDSLMDPMATAIAQLFWSLPTPQARHLLGIPN
jgi:hypothetical protein